MPQPPQYTRYRAKPQRRNPWTRALAVLFALIALCAVPLAAYLIVKGSKDEGPKPALDDFLSRWSSGDDKGASKLHQRSDGRADCAGRQPQGARRRDAAGHADVRQGRGRLRPRERRHGVEGAGHRPLRLRDAARAAQDRRRLEGALGAVGRAPAARRPEHAPRHGARHGPARRDPGPQRREAGVDDAGDPRRRDRQPRQGSREDGERPRARARRRRQAAPDADRERRTAAVRRGDRSCARTTTRGCARRSRRSRA